MKKCPGCKKKVGAKDLATCNNAEGPHCIDCHRQHSKSKRKPYQIVSK